MAYAISDIYKSERGVILPINELSPPSEDVSDLDFRSLALEKIGWHPASDYRKAIHELIKFCEINFGSKK